jgi:hypothetical protein
MTRAFSLVLALALPAAAAAQTRAAPLANAHCGTLAAVAGLSFADGEAGPMIGVASKWALAPGVAIEGKASWFDRNRGAEFFAATINVVVTLAEAGPAHAFAKGGLGVLTADLDVSRHAPPAFYGRRINAPGPGQDRFGFTDPAVAFGGGISVQLSRHLSLRPEVEALLAWRGGRSFVTANAAVQLAFHFERHVVTPDRRVP